MRVIGTCSVENCNGSVYCKGYCYIHYTRMRRYGRLNRINREDGSGTIRGGYLYTMVDGKRKNEHLRIAEKALGRKLPKGSEVHHFDGDTLNNARSNLVICPSRDYHRLLHQRQRAMDICGHADWLKCSVCCVYDAPENLQGSKTQSRRRFHKGEFRLTCNRNRGIHV